MRSSYFVFYRHDAKAPLGGALRPAASAKACPRAAPGCARGGLRERSRGPSGPSTGTAASFLSAERPAHGPPHTGRMRSAPKQTEEGFGKIRKMYTKNAGLQSWKKSAPPMGRGGKAHSILAKLDKESRKYLAIQQKLLSNIPKNQTIFCRVWLLPGPPAGGAERGWETHLYFRLPYFVS